MFLNYLQWLKFFERKLPEQKYSAPISRQNKIETYQVLKTL